MKKVGSNRSSRKKKGVEQQRRNSARKGLAHEKTGGHFGQNSNDAAARGVGRARQKETWFY